VRVEPVVGGTTVRETLLYGLDATHTRAHRCLEDLTEDEARRSPTDGLSPIVWQVGHLAYYDAVFARLVDGRAAAPNGYEALFKAGTGGKAAYPSLHDVQKALDSGQEALVTVARSADPAMALDHPRYHNVGEMITFAIYHRGYHIGKINTLRALLHKARLFG
jgi:hypothetical protein